MKKRVISMLILAALAANLAACGDEKTTSKETTSSGNETITSADDSSPFEKDDLPDNLNFGGKKVTWFIVTTTPRIGTISTLKNRTAHV